VADAPVPHIEGFGAAVFDPHPGVPALILEVAVLHPIAHLFFGTRASVGTDVGLCAYQAAPVDELVRPEGIRLFNTPCLVEARLTVLSYTISPVIGRHEASAGPAHDRNSEFPPGFYDIEPKTFSVGQR